MNTLIAVCCAYLIGSIPFAVVMSKLFGLADPRTYGSKNPGATNVLRSGNKSAAALTLLFDACKGWLPVWLAVHFGAGFYLQENSVVAVMLAVFLGHLYPVFLRFKGGKGVATALGILLGLYWWLGLATLTTWLLIALFFRYSSLAAILAAVFAPFYYLILIGIDPTALGLVVISGLIIWRHRKNIANLSAGSETRIGRQ